MKNKVEEEVKISKDVKEVTLLNFKFKILLALGSD